MKKYYVNAKNVCSNKTTEAKVELAPPWIEYFSKLKKLFEQDPEIHIEADEVSSGPVITMRIDSQKKYEALKALLPEVVNFGSVEAKIRLIPANKTPSTSDLFEAAFYGNPIVDEVIHIDGVMSNPLTYFLFKKEVVQFYNDDLSDPHGMCSTLYQDIASQIFDEDREGVLFCTQSKE